MRTEFTVLPAAPKDAETLAALEAACFSEPWRESALLGAMLDSRYICLKACRGEETAGYALFQNICSEGYVCSIAVFPAFRRRGAASALLGAMKAYADENLQFLTLEVRPSNTAATALYAKAGFCPAGRRKNFYRKPTEDALLMTYTPKRDENTP